VERKDRNWLAGIAGVSAGLMLVVILLILLLPAPASGPLPTPRPTASPPPPKPTPTPKPTSTALPTATAGPQGGNGGGGTVQPTATADGRDGTPTAGATLTPSPTATAAGQDGVTVYFNQSPYSVDESEAFWTGVMISEVDYFWGAQFDIEYDYSLIEARPGAARRGSLYDVNTGNWTEADFLSVAKIEDGLIRLQVSWENYPPAHGSRGIETTGGTLAHLKWKAAASTGSADISFVGIDGISKLLVGYGTPPDIAWEIAPVTWVNSSVSVH